MRVTTPAVTETGFIALCIQLPSKADPKAPADASRAPKEPDWITALGNWFHRQEVKNREAYLAQSTDVFDLERRIRYLERRAYY